MADVREASLVTGDYTVEGLEDIITIERKSLEDYLGCINQSRDRFKRELMRMKAYRFRLVLIEASVRDVYEFSGHAQVHPNSVIGSTMSWIARYQVPFMFGDNAEHCAELATAFMRNSCRLCTSFCVVCKGKHHDFAHSDDSGACAKAEREQQLDLRSVQAANAGPVGRVLRRSVGNGSK